MCVLRDIERETRFERSNRILAPELRGYVRRKVRHARIHVEGEKERGAEERERRKCISHDRNRNLYQQSVITCRFLQNYYELTYI